ncbi:MAG: segregation/condensation protein A [Armatimonadota bacterium]|nr:segregation/condensation protein A [Armatimonadota bacterium]
MSLEQTTQSTCTIKLPIFEGPLDLLLHLIREHKLNIYDIPIVEVTEQYLRYLWLMESLDLNIAGEFFVMAATLLEIKSRMLLPNPVSEEEGDEGVDPRAELVERLLEYERYKKAAETLRAFEDNRQKVFWRLTDELESYDAPVIPLNLEAMDLILALQKMLAEIGEGSEEVTSLERRKITLRMKMSEVLRKVRNMPEGINFRELFIAKPTRVEIIITFLALLELLRLGKIKIKQKQALGDISIHSNEEQPT